VWQQADRWAAATRAGGSLVSTARPRVLELEASSLSVSVDLVAGRITLTGELDRENAHHLVDAVEALSATRHQRWDVDTAGVTFCDAGGLRGLVAVRVTAAERGRSVSLLRPSRCVDRLVRMVGMGDLVQAAGRPPVAVPPLARRRLGAGSTPRGAAVRTAS
jgi:anti-sigma B factor antagonist